MSDSPVRDELEQIRRLLHDRLSQDDVKEKAFDALYEEMSRYKDDFLFQAEKGLLMDLLLFYDSMSWFQESLVSQEMTPEVIADSFQYLLDEFMEILYRRDVSPVEASEGFDRKLHKAVKIETTDDADKDFQIAQILKRGFVRNEKVLRAEEVVIYRTRGSNSNSGDR